MIRAAYQSDYKRIIELLEFLAPTGTPINEYAAITFMKLRGNPDCDTLVWIPDTDYDEIIAVGTVWYIQKMIHSCGIMAQIEDVVVDPKHRGCGYGKMITDALIDKARIKGCYKVILNCSEDNILFYEKCGFRKHENTMRIDL